MRFFSDNADYHRAVSQADEKMDWSAGDVIAAYEDGTIVLDDGITTWNPIRARAFLGTSTKPTEKP